MGNDPKFGGISWSTRKQIPATDHRIRVLTDHRIRALTGLRTRAATDHHRTRAATNLRTVHRTSHQTEIQMTAIVNNFNLRL